MVHPQPSRDGKYDVFISHATEDKEFATPLAEELRGAGLKVWYDDFELSIGDSLNESINYGLSQSRYGVVVLSPTFFKKHWTQVEMNGFVARQTTGEQVILPIWHRITKAEIIEQAPPLADIVSLNSSTHSIEEIVIEIVKKVRKTEPEGFSRHEPIGEDQGTVRSFGVFYIANVFIPELPEDEEPEKVFFPFTIPQSGWLSMVSGDEELEYILDGTTLRVRVDWGNQWVGDEYLAYQLLSGDNPFALTIRPSEGKQIYFPSVINLSRNRGFGRSSRSGWMVCSILCIGRWRGLMQ